MEEIGVGEKYDVEFGGPRRLENAQPLQPEVMHLAAEADCPIPLGTPSSVPGAWDVEGT